ncbi:MAG: MBL fold metallo-hydrolase [Deltaproteobacteria bacterium]|nr:MAG: MBL fold metallo-hydrolase [Deltaproteobacteria bacterium]
MKVFEDLEAFLWMNPTTNNCNTYLIKGDKNILIDPGHHHLFSHVLDGLSLNSLSIEDIDIVIITHGHPDHLESVRRFLNLSTVIAMAEIELDFIRKIAPHYGEALGIPHFEPHVLLRGGDLHLGNIRLEVIESPGHSPGSVCLYWPDRKALFTGDVIFNGGIGRTDLPGGNGEQLKQSIQKLSRLDVTYVLPGHGEIISGAEYVKANFREIESFWFGYI